MKLCDLRIWKPGIYWQSDWYLIGGDGRMKLLLCGPAAREVIGDRYGSRITLSAHDAPPDGEAATAVKVVKESTVWWWLTETHDRRCLYPAVQQTLNRIFPDARTDEPIDIWLSVAPR